MIVIRVMVAVALTACATPAAPPVTRPRPRVGDPFTKYPAITTTGSTHYFTPGGLMTEAVPWKIGQWVVYKRNDGAGIDLEQLRIVSQDACGFWIERSLHNRGRPKTWMFCVRAQPSPDDPNLYESLSAVIERRGRFVVSVEDFRVGSADRTASSWLVSLVHAPWSGRTDVPREDVPTPLGVFHEAAKLTVAEGNGETTRWSHAVVPLGGVVKEVAPDHYRVLVAFGMASASATSPLVAAASDLESAQRQASAQRPGRQPDGEESDCLIGIRLSPKVCQSTPRRFVSLGAGLGGVSRNGDVPPLGDWTWRMQFGQRLRSGLHLVEEMNLVTSGITSLTPSVLFEDHLSFGAGIRWAPFAPKLRPSDPFPYVARYRDFHAFYFTAVAGANARDRRTQITATEMREDIVWSPMASLAVGLFLLQGSDWSLGPEFREQIAIYDGRLQRGWQLLFAIHLNGW